FLETNRADDRFSVTASCPCPGDAQLGPRARRAVANGDAEPAEEMLVGVRADDVCAQLDGVDRDGAEGLTSIDDEPDATVRAKPADLFEGGTKTVREVDEAEGDHPRLRSDKGFDIVDLIATASILDKPNLNSAISKLEPWKNER